MYTKCVHPVKQKGSSGKGELAAEDDCPVWSIIHYAACSGGWVSGPPQPGSDH